MSSAVATLTLVHPLLAGGANRPTSISLKKDSTYTVGRTAGKAPSQDDQTSMRIVMDSSGEHSRALILF